MTLPFLTEKQLRKQFKDRVHSVSVIIKNGDYKRRFDFPEVMFSEIGYEINSFSFKCSHSGKYHVKDLSTKRNKKKWCDLRTLKN